MKQNKLTKAEIKAEIIEILNVITQDMANQSNNITTNEVYYDMDDEFVELTKSARIIALEAMTSSDSSKKPRIEASAEQLQQQQQQQLQQTTTATDGAPGSN